MSITKKYTLEDIREQYLADWILTPEGDKLSAVTYDDGNSNYSYVTIAPATEGFVCKICHVHIDNNDVETEDIHSFMLNDIETLNAFVAGMESCGLR